ncbi:unnamed protein product [Didymodactylos carnosus]|uniref:Uncharacterized protein n=1 Tax=Didymodactylos carnosus TaxID=1234261 RepID=A0A814FNN6_9BILA|nr:unnamed protein product [Didymodactylos carnosus]CAF1413992.1 unnamed protein product [Didymodactylos carnosus]CAF3758357.1 unnamed protein product [Didymodactylos carnosus]CAF4216996.1 unnamed protein product [Didymodactylos carnosus]
MNYNYSNERNNWNRSGRPPQQFKGQVNQVQQQQNQQNSQTTLATTRVHQQLLENQRVNLNSNTNSSSPPIQLQPQLICTPTTHKRGLDESTSGVRQKYKKNTQHNQDINNNMNTSVINVTTTLPQALREQQITQSQHVQSISFQQLKRAVSSNLPCFLIEFDPSVDRKEIPFDITAANLLEQYFSFMNYNITFSLVGHTGNKLKVGVNNKENYAHLMSANIWPDKVENVGITVIKPSYILDTVGIVVRFLDQQYDDEFVKSEIERNFQSTENIRNINYAFQRRNNDYRFNVKVLREYNSALQRGRISIGNNLCSITPFKVEIE